MNGDSDRHHHASQSMFASWMHARLIQILRRNTYVIRLDALDEKTGHM